MKGSLYVNSLHLCCYDIWNQASIPDLMFRLSSTKTPSLEKLLEYMSTKIGPYGRIFSVSILRYSKKKEVMIWSYKHGFSQGVNPKAPVNAELARFYLDSPTACISHSHYVMLQITFTSKPK